MVLAIWVLDFRENESAKAKSLGEQFKSWQSVVFKLPQKTLAGNFTGRDPVQASDLDFLVTTSTNDWLVLNAGKLF